MAVIKFPQNENFPHKTSSRCRFYWTLSPTKLSEIPFSFLPLHNSIYVYNTYKVSQEWKKSKQQIRSDRNFFQYNFFKRSGVRYMFRVWKNVQEFSTTLETRPHTIPNPLPPPHLPSFAEKHSSHIEKHTVKGTCCRKIPNRKTPTWKYPRE